MNTQPVIDFRLTRRGALAAVGAGTGVLLGGVPLEGHGGGSRSVGAAQTASLDSGALGLTRDEFVANLGDGELVDEGRTEGAARAAGDPDGVGAGRSGPQRMRG